MKKAETGIKKLKALAHHLDPVIQIGQKGLTENLVKAVDKALDDHELIKVKFLEFKEDKKELAVKIAESTKSLLVNIIGNVAIFYKESSIEEKRKIKLK
jgi:RNA-binding protein